METEAQFPHPLPLSSKPGWSTLSLADLCESGGGVFKFGVRVPPEELAQSDDQRPVLGTPVRADFATQNAQFALRAGDLVCNRRGDLTRKMYVNADRNDVIADIDCLLVRLPEGAVSSRYLYYYLEHTQIKQWLRRLSAGKATPQLNKRWFGALQITYPDQNFQRELCDALNAIDRKIEINQEINRTLEQKTHTLLAEAVNAAGSEIRSCGELCTRMENGRTPRKDEPDFWSPATIPWITSTEVRQEIVLQAAQAISTQGLNRTYMKTWPKGAIIVALCGETAGKVARLALTASGNQACCALIPRQNFEDYLYVYLRHAGTSLSRLCTGTAFRSLNQKILADFPITVPTPVGLDHFNHAVKPLLEKLEQSCRQIIEMRALRERLLEQFIQV